MKKIIIKTITIYQKFLSFDTGKIPAFFGKNKPTCIYYPTCSEYTKQSIEEYGVFKGILLSAKRIGRCNPFHEPGVDLVIPRAHKK